MAKALLEPVWQSVVRIVAGATRESDRELLPGGISHPGAKGRANGLARVRGWLVAPYRLPDRLQGPLRRDRDGGQYNTNESLGGIVYPTTDKAGRFRAEVIPGVRFSGSVELKPSFYGGKLFEATLKPGQIRDLGDVKLKWPQQR
jgi:hypothetical protein